MPAQFDAFGIRFLYPENWKTVDRDDSEGEQGVTFDLPDGGFLAIEVTEADGEDQLRQQIVAAIAEEYEDLEHESAELDVLPPGIPATDLRFYYLDLLIMSRVVILPYQDLDGAFLVVQMQAESRDFDKNEAVFAAVLKQITDASS